MKTFGSRVRIMTWNIHGGIGPDGRFDLTRVVSTIARHDPDVVALQEVDSRRRSAGDPSPFSYLREAIGHYGIEAKSIITDDGEYGQMLVSRWPLTDTEIHDISISRREPRRAIETQILGPGGSFRVIASHFGLGFAERRVQARRIIGIARDHPLPTILLGDFNDWAWPSSLRDALRRELPGRTREKTYPAWLPLMRLDRMYCWPRAILLSSFVDRGARLCSDHLPLIADFAIGADQAATLVTPGANRE